MCLRSPPRNFHAAPEAQLVEPRVILLQIRLDGPRERQVGPRRSVGGVPGTVYTRAVARLNLTLDQDTFARLEKHARESRTRRATLAKTLIQEALEGREAARRRRKLAADYAAERDDARDLLRELEAGQLELLD
jgi:ribosomal protein L25 (general stress protein Ctc)